MDGRIRTLHRFSAWGGAHVQTCINILRGMAEAGGDVHLDLTRTRVEMGAVPHAVSIGRPFARFGLPRIEPRLQARTEARFLATLKEGEIAYLWPETSLSVFHEVARRGNPIVMEGINTRIASARRILERVHAAEGLVFDDPSYSDARIAAEDEALSLARAFFAPAPGVEAAIAEPDSGFSGHVMPTSFGAWLPPADRIVPRTRPGPLRVLAAGSVDLRKNAQGLLRAWARLAPKGATLVLAGGVTPAIARLCAAELRRDDVEVMGHAGDMDAVYRAADILVMPSFEEGGPQVQNEAAGYGIPVLASPMGGGRMAERTDAVHLFDPWDIDDIAGAIDLFLSDAARRADHAARAREAAALFDWNVVGAERLALLRAAPQAA